MMIGMAISIGDTKKLAQSLSYELVADSGAVVLLDRERNINGIFDTAAEAYVHLLNIRKGRQEEVSGIETQEPTVDEMLQTVSYGFGASVFMRYWEGKYHVTASGEGYGFTVSNESLVSAVEGVYRAMEGLGL